MPALPPTAQADFELRTSCKRWLSGHRPASVREKLQGLLLSDGVDFPADIYGDGTAIDLLEREVADLLGKEAAVFVHKGVAAQLMALAALSEARNANVVALHRNSHLERDEEVAYERLLSLNGLRLGEDAAHFTPACLEAAGVPAERLAAVVLELPLRRGGFLLPTWEELSDLSTWCRQKGVPLHFDGARIWESAPYYAESGHGLKDVCALADSVYVSFYKGLGGLAGSVLAGDRAFIASTRAWKARLAGNVYTLFPYVLSAKEGLKRHLPRMGWYLSRARELARGLAALPGVIVNPGLPRTNSFQVFLPGEPDTLMERMRHLARRQGDWLFGWCSPAAVPSLSMVEIVVGEAFDDWTVPEAVERFSALLGHVQEG